MEGVNATVSLELNVGASIKEGNYQLRRTESDCDVKRTIIGRALVGIGTGVYQCPNESDVFSFYRLVEVGGTSRTRHEKGKDSGDSQKGNAWSMTLHSTLLRSCRVYRLQTL
jgi:hypothetical protein